MPTDMAGSNPFRLALSCGSACTKPRVCYVGVQAQEKWGTWGRPAGPVDNGLSEVRFAQLSFSRPVSVARHYEPNEGYTGIVQASPDPQDTLCYQTPDPGHESDAKRVCAPVTAIGLFLP